MRRGCGEGVQVVGVKEPGCGQVALRYALVAVVCLVLAALAARRLGAERWVSRSLDTRVVGLRERMATLQARSAAPRPVLRGAAEEGNAADDYRAADYARDQLLAAGEAGRILLRKAVREAQDSSMENAGKAISQIQLPDLSLPAASMSTEGRAKLLKEEIDATYEELRQALLAAAAAEEATPRLTDRFGARYVIDFLIDGPAGSATLRSLWILRQGEDTPRLTSCYVK